MSFIEWLMSTDFDQLFLDSLTTLNKEQLESEKEAQVGLIELLERNRHEFPEEYYRARKEKLTRKLEAIDRLLLTI